MLSDFPKGSPIHEWLSTASKDDIKLALEIGAEVLAKVNNRRGAVAPAVKGQIGESFVENILREKYGGVINVAKTSKSGDLNFYIAHRKIMVEVKNYSSVVPTTEVEKFARDLITTGAAAGLFISLNTSIAKIPSTFATKFDHFDGRIIPCIYLVSSDEKIILSAADMISQFIVASAYLNSEIYAKDRIGASVYEMSEELSKLSRARGDLQSVAGNLISQINKVTCNISAAETNMNRSVENIRQELFGSASANHNEIMAELAQNASFTRFSPEIQAEVGAVINKVGGTWTVSAKACYHTTGQGFSFMARGIRMIIPIDYFTDAKILELMKTLGKKLAINDMKVEVDFGPETMGLIS